MPLDGIDPIAIALRPLAEALASGEDVAVNRPGEAWWHVDGAWKRLVVPTMTEQRLRGIATLAASQTKPSVRQAIISTDIPSGHRGEFLLPPAVLPGTVGMCLRRSGDEVAEVGSIRSRFDVSRWNKWGERKGRERAQDEQLLALFDAGDIEGFLAAFAKARRTPLFCGATGVGKTYLLKTYLTLLDADARVLVIEDAKEAVLRQPNHLRLIFQRGGITPTQLLVTGLRLRPDFIVLQEMRDAEASWIFCNEGVAGHPGSPTTIHGASPREAALRLFNNIKGSAEGSSMSDETVIALMSATIDLIAPIQNIGGVRSLGEVWFAADAARRGETLADLVRGNAA
jgi:type IV secretion system protein VirB11